MPIKRGVQNTAPKGRARLSTITEEEDEVESGPVRAYDNDVVLRIGLKGKMSTYTNGGLMVYFTVLDGITVRAVEYGLAMFVDDICKLLSHFNPHRQFDTSDIQACDKFASPRVVKSPTYEFIYKHSVLKLVDLYWPQGATAIKEFFEYAGTKAPLHNTCVTTALAKCSSLPPKVQPKRTNTACWHTQTRHVPQKAACVAIIAQSSSTQATRQLNIGRNAKDSYQHSNHASTLGHLAWLVDGLERCRTGRARLYFLNSMFTPGSSTSSGMIPPASSLLRWIDALASISAV